MPITGKFEADFASFQAAVETAEISLRSFEAGSSKVETALTRMTDTFSGRKLISEATLMVEAVDRIGGSSKLTDSELAKLTTTVGAAADKMRAMGIDVPVGFTKITEATQQTAASTGGLMGWVDALGHSFVARVAEGVLLRDAVRELIDIGKEAITDAAKFEDLSKATGLSVDAIQRLGYVGVEFGVTLEEMARGVEQLSTKLANGDPNAVKAVQMLGLNVQDLLAMGPKDAFLAIAEATGRVQDPMVKAALASDEFGGKLAKILLPALGELGQKMAAVPAAAIISDANVQAAHDFDVGLQHLLLTVKAYSLAAIEYVANAEHQHPPVVAAAHDIELLADAHDKAAAAAGGAITTAQLLQNRLTALRTEAVDPLNAAQRASIDELVSYGVSHKEIAQLVGTTEIAIKRYEDALKAGAEAAKKATEGLAKAQADADAIAIAGYAARIKGLDEMAKASLKAYGFDAQVAALSQLDAAERALAASVYDQLTSEKDRAKVIEDTSTRHIALMNEIAAVRLKQAGVVNTAVIAELDAQAKLNAEYGRTADGTLKVSSAADTYRLALDKLHESAVAGFSQAKQEQVLIDAYTKALYDEAVAQDAATASLAKVPIAAAAADHAVQQFSNTLVLGISDLATLNQALSAFYDTYAGQNSAGTPGGGNSAGIPTGGNSAGMPRVAGARAGGGDVMAGQSYLVGERGPELYTPSANGSIAPNGSAGTTTVHNTIYVNGTAADVARQVAAEILRTLTAGQKLRLT